MIKLRALEPADADFMYEIENDEGAWRYAERVAPLSRTLLRDYAINYDANPFASGQLRLVITDKDTGSPAGLLDFYELCVPQRRAYVGIFILPSFRDRGYAAETLRAAEEFASKHLRLRLLAANIDDSNAASLRLFSKAGFTLHTPIADWFEDAEGHPSSLVIATLKL